MITNTLKRAAAVVLSSVQVPVSSFAAAVEVVVTHAEEQCGEPRGWDVFQQAGQGFRAQGWMIGKSQSC